MAREACFKSAELYLEFPLKTMTSDENQAAAHQTPQHSMTAHS